VIHAGLNGFTEVQFRETDGKVGQALFIWSDDFTVLSQTLALVPTFGAPGVAGLVLLLALVGSRFAVLRFRAS